ncbi:MAG TPA: hypothetical protein VK948_01635 [Aeromicrobium sp.]|nr:hypothetical protein [Aeromicrobium sp.]
MIGRIAIATLGILLAAWGSWMLLSNSNADQLLSAGVWLVAGVVAHDFVLAPLTLAAGWLLIRVLPAWSRGAVAGGAIVLGTLTVVGLPMLGGWGRRPDMPSLLPRDYWAGWFAVAGIVAIGVVVLSLITRARERRSGA